MSVDECVRVYNKDGEHVLTILGCLYEESKFDLATPDGEVEYCGVPLDIVKLFVEKLGLGSIEVVR